MDIPANAAEHCPGTQSDAAGKSSACAGCPNQQICSSGQVEQVDPDISVITSRLHSIKHKILVLSGKGGVGKSTVTAMIARTLALFEEKEIGVLDIDICGPSQPRLLGAKNEKIHSSGNGWSPVFVSENLSVMSIGFLLNSHESAVIWRGPKKNGLIKQFLKDVDWGDLDYLVIDTPPGTSDEHLSITQYLSTSHNSAAVIVTTPQEVALLDVRKEITFCQKVGIPIIGVIENMTTFICPKCNTETNIFPATTGGGGKLAEEFNIPFLGQLPLDPKVAHTCDQGINFIVDEPSAPASISYKKITKKLIQYFTDEL